jgi:hypothetical protein
MKSKTLSLSKPQRTLLLNTYRIGGGIIALHNPSNSVTTLHIYVDRSGILRHSATDKPVFPLYLRTPVGTSALPYAPPSYENGHQNEARTQALVICHAANRHLAEIDAVQYYRRDAVHTFLQREATGWDFRVLVGSDAIQLVVDAPEGLSWLLARDVYGCWTTCPDQQREQFEQSWGGVLHETWTQRILDTATFVISRTYHYE